MGLKIMGTAFEICLATSSFHFSAMLPPMKSSTWATAKAMTKGQISKKLAEANGMKQTACSKMLNSFVAIASKEVKQTRLFSIAGLCRIKTRVKPASKAGVRMAFGKEMQVKAKPARTIVKAFPAAALKKQVI